jgi:uncharacterized membrane protein YsdA (DUF1294 family)
MAIAIAGGVAGFILGVVLLRHPMRIEVVRVYRALTARRSGGVSRDVM